LTEIWHFSSFIRFLAELNVQNYLQRSLKFIFLPIWRSLFICFNFDILQIGCAKNFDRVNFGFIFSSEYADSYLNRDDFIELGSFESDFTEILNGLMDWTEKSSRSFGSLGLIWIDYDLR
jgi:hypothetical protein